MLRHGRLMVPGHPSWPHRPLGILPTRRRRGSSPSLAPTSSSVNLLPGGEPSTRHSCANIYVSIDILLGIVYHASLCCGIYPHPTTTTILLLLFNNIITSYLLGGISSDLLQFLHRQLMQCLHQIILYYYNIITSYLLGGLSSDLRWCLHQQLMQCLLSWVAETLLPSSWHAELLSIVRLMRAVFVLPSSSWGVCIPPAWYAELPHCSAHVGCFVLSSSSWGVHHPMASSWHAELPHCSAHVGCSVLPSSSWGVHHPSASWHAESIHSAHDGFVVLPSSSWGVHFLPPHGMLNPSIRLMMALLYLLHFMGGTMSFTASFCYLHGKMMAPVLHRLILLSPWQDGGSFRHLAL